MTESRPSFAACVVRVEQIANAVAEIGDTFYAIANATTEVNDVLRSPDEGGRR